MKDKREPLLLPAMIARCRVRSVEATVTRGRLRSALKIRFSILKPKQHKRRVVFYWVVPESAPFRLEELLRVTHTRARKYLDDLCKPLVGKHVRAEIVQAKYPTTDEEGRLRTAIANQVVRLFEDA